MLTALLIALTPVTPKKPNAPLTILSKAQNTRSAPVIYLKTNSLLLTSEVNHAVRQYCLTYKTKTLEAVEADITSNVNTLLKIPRMIQANKLEHSEITNKEYNDRYVSDTMELRGIIKKLAKRKCPS
jgi:hypothetical protein